MIEMVFLDRFNFVVLFSITWNPMGIMRFLCGLTKLHAVPFQVGYFQLLAAILSHDLHINWEQHDRIAHCLQPTRVCFPFLFPYIITQFISIRGKTYDHEVNALFSFS